MEELYSHALGHLLVVQEEPLQAKQYKPLNPRRYKRSRAALACSAKGRRILQAQQVLCDRTEANR